MAFGLKTLFGGGKTATDAAQDQYLKQTAAIGAIEGAGGEYDAALHGLYAPYASYGSEGRTTNDLLSRLLSNPESVRSLPGYQFDMSEGINALDRSAAARGMLNSGRQSKDLLRFGTGLADKTYGAHFARLMGAGDYFNKLGLAGTAGQAQGARGLLDARTTAFGGRMGSAGTMAQGKIAGAQMDSDALSQLLALAGYAGGKAMGSGGLSSFMGSGGGAASPVSAGVYGGIPFPIFG